MWRKLPFCYCCCKSGWGENKPACEHLTVGRASWPETHLTRSVCERSFTTLTFQVRTKPNILTGFVATSQISSHILQGLFRYLNFISLLFEVQFSTSVPRSSTSSVYSKYCTKPRENKLLYKNMGTCLGRKLNSHWITEIKPLFQEAGGCSLNHLSLMCVIQMCNKNFSKQ